MSLKVMALAWESELGHAAKLVLLALADNANDEGLCFPSVQTLMRKCGMGERTVQDQLSALRSAGHIECHYRQGRSTYYTVHPRSSRTGAATAPPQQPHPTGAATAPPPVRQAHPGGAATAPITVIEPSIEPSGNRKRVPRDDEPDPPGLDPKAWELWNDYKRFKPKSIRLAKKKLAQLGSRQMEAVEHSIANQYQGVYLPKGSPAVRPEPVRKWLQSSEEPKRA